MSNTVEAANGTGTASPSEVPGVHPAVRVDQSLLFCVILCENLSFCYFSLASVMSVVLFDS